MSRGNSYLFFLSVYVVFLCTGTWGKTDKKKKKGGRGIRARDLEKLKI